MRKTESVGWFIVLGVLATVVGSSIAWGPGVGMVVFGVWLMIGAWVLTKSSGDAIDSYDQEFKYQEHKERERYDG